MQGSESEHALHRSMGAAFNEFRRDNGKRESNKTVVEVKENEWTWQNGKITEVVAAMCKTLSQSKHHYYVENCLAKFHSEPTSCSLISLKAACLICFLAFTAKRIFDENYISMRSSKVHLTIVIHTENNCISTEYYVAITWEFSVTFSFSPI